MEPLSPLSPHIEPDELARQYGTEDEEMGGTDMDISEPGDVSEEVEMGKTNSEFTDHRQRRSSISLTSQIGEEVDAGMAEEGKHGCVDEDGDVSIVRHHLVDESRDTAMGRAVDLEPERTSRGSSEASTIRLSPSKPSRTSKRPRALSLAPNDAASIAPTTTSATSRIPGSALPTSLQEWRYRDAVLPTELPKTIGQWAKLEHKVRMITPLPDATKPAHVSEGLVKEVRKAFEEMWVKEQKRVCEVVRKSWGPADEEYGKRFLTGVDKKGQQIHWDNLSYQAIRNVKAMIEYIEYEDFEAGIRETETWKADDEEAQFRVVKSGDNFYGVGWELRDSRGHFSGTEDEMMAYHDKVWPKKEEADVSLVLREGEDQLPVRMQLKDGEEGVKLKGKGGRKKGTKPKLGQAKRGVLVGGEPGAWGFWTQPEDRHLRDWVLSAQGDAFAG